MKPPWRQWTWIPVIFVSQLLVGPALGIGFTRPVVIGSKKFTESYILGEIARIQLERAGVPATHRPGMGGTIILWQALKAGAIDVYPDYTGTIQEEILRIPGKTTAAQLRTALARFGVGMTADLGFNNTYALVMRRDRAQSLGIRRISDLRGYPDLRFGLTHEFLKRQDGWEPLRRAYGLSARDVRGIDHTLGYVALQTGAIDVKDAYSTDAKIAEYDLVVLEDDRRFFPAYRAVFLYRLDLDARAVAALRRLAGTLDEARMMRLNAEAEQSKDYTRAAALYFGVETRGEAIHRKIVRWTLQHLLLVGLSLLWAVAVGVPLGIWASRPGIPSQLILGITGMIYTIPSLALLALLVPVPFLGIRPTTAVVALFLYSLLPIVRNTATGLQNIPAALRDAAAALGLEPGAQLRKVFLPMAARTILAGIKTSAVINVGTATLAALIGAGGLGEPIISGLNLNDHGTILQGAIPAALLALAVQALFEGLDRRLIPRGLRLEAARRT
ncbi:MAG: ABC transporter permease subunit [Acidobacteria bacterium]|nr:ABC transporter permease subunit [Acidobacteriota bacterium]MDW7984616.1 glycine betaine ABC transporter substrate-binding protein [Acidobacteriota bacterium]